MALSGMIISDEAINDAFSGTDFGPNMETIEQKRREVARAILKKTCNYSTGHTMSCILQDLGLTKTLHGNPTKAARRWMYDVYMSIYSN